MPESSAEQAGNDVAGNGSSAWVEKGSSLIKHAPVENDEDSIPASPYSFSASISPTSSPASRVLDIVKVELLVPDEFERV